MLRRIGFEQDILVRAELRYALRSCLYWCWQWACGFRHKGELWVLEPFKTGILIVKWKNSPEHSGYRYRISMLSISS